MIAITVIAAFGQAVHDAVIGFAVFGLVCALALMAVMAVVALGVRHDRRHGCKEEHGRRLSRRERAVLKEIETQGDLGHNGSGSEGAVK